MSAHRQYLAAVKQLETEIQKNLQLQEQIEQLDNNIDNNNQ